MFQARLDEEFAEEVHKYRDEQHMSKSEVVRHGLREVVDDERREPVGDEADEADDEAIHGVARQATGPVAILQVIQIALLVLLLVQVGGGVV